MLGMARRFGPLALIAAVAVAVIASGLIRHLSLHELRTNRQILEAFVAAHPFGSAAAYVGLYVVVVALSLPVALVMTLAGGLLFGPWIGGAAAAIGCTLGAVVIFMVCRTALGDVLRRRAGPLAARIEDGIERDAFSYVVALRLIPIAPFWLVNLALGFFDIPPLVFGAATFLGILPVSVIYAGLGAGLHRLFVHGARPNLHMIFEPRILLPLAGLAILALAPIIWRRVRPRALPKSRL
jgi:uncharacterized membrane protein YdjX (TVP38/TMEM64 family)